MNTTSHDGNGNIVEQTVDNGDGTGTRQTFDADGNVTSTVQITGLPIPTPPPPDLDTVFASVPVVSLEEANDTLLALKEALEARGIV
mgnify:CR=1 FL=1